MTTSYNHALYEAARKAGCTPREAEVLAVYVLSDSIKDTAYALGMNVRTAHNHLGKVKKRLGVRHTAAVVAKLAA